MPLANSACHEAFTRSTCETGMNGTNTPFAVANSRSFDCAQPPASTSCALVPR